MKIIKCALIAVIFSFSVFACAEQQIINYPPVKDITLPNGLRVMLIEQNQQETISYRMLVNAARADQPIGREGIADFTASMLQEGTATRTSGQIADDIAAIGSGLSVSPQPKFVIIGMDLLSEFSGRGLDIFSDILLHPSFPSDGYNRIKKDMLNSVQINLTDNDTIAFNHGRCVLFEKGNPLGRTNTKKSIESLKIKDIRKFYETYYRPNNSIMLVIGNFETGQMLQEITARFGSWQRAEIPARFETKPDFHAKGKIRVVDKPGMTQAVIYLNQWSPDSTSSRYYDYQLANYVLGGGNFSSRLTYAVRSKGGMTYHIGSFTNIHSNYGVLNITTSTRNQELYNAYKLILSEIQNLSDKGVSEDELQKAQNYISGAIPLQLESPGQVADKILTSIMRDFTINDLSKEVINYNKVTVADVNSVMREYLKAETFNTVVVCDFDKVKPQLDQIGAYEIVNYKADPCK
ncbi:MAG: Peptidase M16 inactive domain protein [Planctomycetes bacterium ADurb.Bin401]|nr:MAG: Peptidase M16 inactive domain protein [Planctomycetes bacterium ADurb.Bin401]